LDEQKEIIKTFSEMAPRYYRLMDSELYKFWGFRYNEFIEAYFDKLEINTNEKILDIATGTGHIPFCILKKYHSKVLVYGFDLTYEMLRVAKRKNSIKSDREPFYFCASAHAIPIAAETFHHVLCCLATHHMNVNLLLDNVYLCLKRDGKFRLADAGGSVKWKNTIIKNFIKLFAFLYFLIFENISRAKAESMAIANILTVEEWRILLRNKGFKNIKIQELKSKRFWAPNPLIIEASKKKEKT